MTTTSPALERRIPAQRHAAAHVAQYIHELSARHARDRRAAERGAHDTAGLTATPTWPP